MNPDQSLTALSSRELLVARGRAPLLKWASWLAIVNAALMGLIGCAAAMITDQLDSPWPFVGIILPVAVLLAIAYFIDAWRGRVGQTTEMAALVTIIAGALCYWNFLALAVAMGVATTVLLSLKLETDRLVRRISREDVRATLQFAVITAIVLHTVGAVGLKYVLLKAGIHTPLLPTLSYSHLL